MSRVPLAAGHVDIDSFHYWWAVVLLIAVVVILFAFNRLRGSR